MKKKLTKPPQLTDDCSLYGNRMPANGVTLNGIIVEIGVTELSRDEKNIRRFFFSHRCLVCAGVAKMDKKTENSEVKMKDECWKINRKILFDCKIEAIFYCY